MKTITELNGMTVAELRTYCRENKSLHSLTGVDIISKQKHELIQALTGTKSIDIDNNSLFAAMDEPKPKPNNGGGNGNGQKDGLAAIIAKAIENEIKPQLDESKVNTLIDQKLNKINSMIDEKMQALNNQKLEIEIKNIDKGTIKNIGRQHERFELILDLVTQRINVNMVGTAGSGKTYMAEQVAAALDLPFYAISVGLQTSKSDLLGYMDANGRYVRTMLREAYENGGVFLIDEIDAGNPNVLTIINAMTSNHVAAFPDGMVKKHKDFVLLAASNTYGRGADRQYVGRMALDGATLDRFAFVTIDIDETLERALAPNKEWCDRVQAIRKAINDLKEKVICSPRATLNGGLAINSGLDREDVEEMFIFKGINPEIKNRILSRI